MHQKVKLFCEETNIEYLESVEDKLKAKFLNDTEPGERTVTIETICRVKFGGLKGHEYVWYVEKHTGKDRKGNDVSILKVIGK